MRGESFILYHSSRLSPVRCPPRLDNEEHMAIRSLPQRVTLHFYEGERREPRWAVYRAGREAGGAVTLSALVGSREE